MSLIQKMSLKPLGFLKNKLFSLKEPILPFLTLIGFLAILGFTWFYFFKSQNRLQKNEEIHVWIQNEFQNLLSDLIEQKHPEISKIIFHKVWTKDTKNPTEIKIFFNYSLSTKGESGGTAHLAGSALLKQSNKEQWKIYDFMIDKNLIDFSEPLVIQANP